MKNTPSENACTYTPIAPSSRRKESRIRFHKSGPTVEPCHICAPHLRRTTSYSNSKTVTSAPHPRSDPHRRHHFESLVHRIEVDNKTTASPLFDVKKKRTYRKSIIGFVMIAAREEPNHAYTICS
ncbi:hypothetical protein EVAR_7135_1 [Eumeta japonica]|uniref:Uncharacterized protein n=1 Tax=Eumeta variegata TaxID=151549 RepID=A0A4C1U6C3_EUMVA|nr:hypothetical protein EVAR_7135_1 [Eumeta japonica]